jgi:hypothetical protein
MTVSEEELERRKRLVRQASIAIMESFLFNGRGLGRTTVDAVVACGIDAPERLLFMTEDQIAQIPGIGEASLREIMQYRERFLLKR